MDLEWGEGEAVWELYGGAVVATGETAAFQGSK